MPESDFLGGFVLITLCLTHGKVITFSGLNLPDGDFVPGLEPGMGRKELAEFKNSDIGLGVVLQPGRKNARPA